MPIFQELTIWTLIVGFVEVFRFYWLAESNLSSALVVSIFSLFVSLSLSLLSLLCLLTWICLGSVVASGCQKSSGHRFLFLA